MPLFSKRAFEIWLAGLWAAVVGAAAGTVNLLVSVPVANSMGFHVQPLDWQQIKTASIGAALIAASLYLKQSPMPKRDDLPPGDSPPKP